MNESSTSDRASAKLRPTVIGSRWWAPGELAVSAPTSKAFVKKTTEIVRATNIFYYRFIYSIVS